MKNGILTYTLLAAAIAITPAYATDKNKQKDKPAQQKAQQVKKDEKKPTPCKEDKDCLNTEIQRLESALDKIDKAVGSRMKDEANKLATAQAELKKTKADCARVQAELKKAKADCADLHKRVAAAEASAKNITSEFNTFKASNEKQRLSTMASLTKIQDASKHTAKENAELKKKNQELEAQCKAACARLKAITDNLEKTEKELSAAKK